MDGTSASPQSLNAQQRSAHIREVVLAEGVRLRQQHPWLLHQDALGAGILAFALLGMLGSLLLSYRRPSLFNNASPLRPSLLTGAVGVPLIFLLSSLGLPVAIVFVVSYVLAATLLALIDLAVAAGVQL